MKPLPTTHITKVAEYDYTTYAIGVGKAPDLPEGAGFDDLFRPQFWAHHYKRLNMGDKIRVRARDGSFDLEICVVSKQPGGVVMEPWPKLPTAISDLHEHGRKVRAVYIPTKVYGKEVPRVEYHKATGWRVIGIDGESHSENHPNQEAAELEMDRMMRALRIEHVALKPSEDEVSEVKKPTRAPKPKSPKEAA